VRYGNSVVALGVDVAPVSSVFEYALRFPGRLARDQGAVVSADVHGSSHGVRIMGALPPDVSPQLRFRRFGVNEFLILAIQFVPALHAPST
jgi:hypothetical protein